MALSPAQRVAISEVLKLTMVVPATNAISKRSASALCRAKKYLRLVYEALMSVHVA